METPITTLPCEELITDHEIFTSYITTVLGDKVQVQEGDDLIDFTKYQSPDGPLEMFTDAEINHLCNNYNLRLVSVYLAKGDKVGITALFERK